MKYTLVGCNLYAMGIGASSPIFSNGKECFICSDKPFPIEEIERNKLLRSIDEVFVESEDFGMENFVCLLSEFGYYGGNPKICVIHFDENAQNILGKENIIKAFESCPSIPVIVNQRSNDIINFFTRDWEKNNLNYFTTRASAEKIKIDFFDQIYHIIVDRISKKEIRITSFNDRKQSEIEQLLDILYLLSNSDNVYKYSVLFGAIRLFCEGQESFDRWVKIACGFQHENELSREEIKKMLETDCKIMMEQLLKEY